MFFHGVAAQRPHKGMKENKRHTATMNLVLELLTKPAKFS